MCGPPPKEEWSRPCFNHRDANTRGSTERSPVGRLQESTCIGSLGYVCVYDTPPASSRTAWGAGTHQACSKGEAPSPPGGPAVNQQDLTLWQDLRDIRLNGIDLTQRAFRACGVRCGGHRHPMCVQAESRSQEGAWAKVALRLGQETPDPPGPGTPVLRQCAIDLRLRTRNELPSITAPRSPREGAPLSVVWGKARILVDVTQARVRRWCGAETGDPPGSPAILHRHPHEASISLASLCVTNSSEKDAA